MWAAASDCPAPPRPEKERDEHHRPARMERPRCPALDHRDRDAPRAGRVRAHGRDARRAHLRRLDQAPRLPSVGRAWDRLATWSGWPRMATSPREQWRQQRKAGAEAAAHRSRRWTRSPASRWTERAELVTGGRRSTGAPEGRPARRARATPDTRVRTSASLPGAAARQRSRRVLVHRFLSDVILTRDPWMHRMDIARAVDRPPVLTAEHDGVLVDDVVAEWARRHDAAYQLTLTGPAGGTWSHGRDGEAIEMDAIDFCRVLSGRRAGRACSPSRFRSSPPTRSPPGGTWCPGGAGAGSWCGRSPA